MMNAGCWIAWTLILVSLCWGPIEEASPGTLGEFAIDTMETSDEEVVLEPLELLELEAGQKALHAAAALKKRAYDFDGEERESGLVRAAAAYGVVADSGHYGVLERVEGAFRAGEIYRARERLDEARQRFEQAVRLGEVVVEPAVRGYAARALLELAHQLRREGRLDEALDEYGAVRNRFGDCPRPSTHALTWSGKIQLKQGRVEEARASFLDFEPFVPDYQMQAVRNIDDLTAALVLEGEVEQAHEVVALLEAALSSTGGRLEDSVASALQSLRDKMKEFGY
ncbi:MAG: tetratricopeptide repeat protein [Planctomycetota bacterium]|nr:tetratricopeptide repeat protein [Planctomycetota bacterium]